MLTDSCGNTSGRGYHVKEEEQELKYKSLCAVVTTNMEHEMYEYTGTGTTGIVTKGLKKNLEAMPGIHSIDSLQRQLYLEHHT